MSLFLSARRTWMCLGLACAAPAITFGQASYIPQATQYPIVGSLPGDQVHPHVALKNTGGYVVWEDNITDGDHLGISAQRLDSSFSAALSTFRVNVQALGDQEQAQVSLLNGGGACFVWQGGLQGAQHIYSRFLSASNTWTETCLTSDVRVSSSLTNYQLNPVVATLANGNVVVVYASFNQAGSTTLQDVYAQVLSPAGNKVGTEFRVNGFTSYNQRNPSVAALSDGRFVVVYVSEQQRSIEWMGETNGVPFGAASVDIYARIFSGAGVAEGGEFPVNTSSAICANPRVVASPNGKFLVAWSEKSRVADFNGWDILARIFPNSTSGGAVLGVNTQRRGDQFAPVVACDGSEFMAVWSSMGQDGSREGVFGQVLFPDGGFDGGEIRINTTTVSQQIHPAVASDGNGRFLAVWTSFTGLAVSFDLFAQRFVNAAVPLTAMNAPFVYVPFIVDGSGTYLPEIQVSWPVQGGPTIDRYEVYVDGSSTPMASLTTNFWTMTAADGLTPGSTHTFQVDYVISSGRRPDLSPAATATAWSGDLNWGGIPSDWMQVYYGRNIFTWPSPNVPVVAGGPTLLYLFLTGGSPLDPSTWLRTNLRNTMQGPFLAWNPLPGLTYQVQASTNLSSWNNFGSPRFAAGASDSLYVGGNRVGYYRVIRLR